jgi:ferritin-like metal-binding protein YciE
MVKAAKKLDDLFHDSLKDIYFAEKKILSALPKMAKAAQDEKLQAAFEKHQRETETHVSRLEQVFVAIDAKPQGKTCDAIMGIIAESQEIIADYKGSPALTPAFSRRPRRWSITKFRAMARCGRGRRN